MGLSNHQAYVQISTLYHCNHFTVKRWLRPDVRQAHINRQRRSFVPYSKNPRMGYRRLHNVVYQDIRRRPDVYLHVAYCNRATQLTLDELTNRIHRLSGIELRNRTLLKIVNQYEQKHSHMLLVKTTNQKPARYLFNKPPGRNYKKEYY
jgi:hypothetical protein